MAQQEQILKIDPKNPPRRYKYNNQHFFKSLITEDGIFYSDYQEGDENACTHVYNPETGELMSNNYFAYNFMFEELLKRKFSYMSPTLKIGYREMDFSEAENTETPSEPF